VAGPPEDLWNHVAALRAIARRRCHDGADAEDLVQETFLRALRAWSTYDDRGNLRGWLITILHRLTVDRRRRSTRTPPFDDIAKHEVAIPEPGEPPPWSEISIDRVHATLARVPAALRETFELHARGQSYDQIARELQIPKNTVGTRLIRTRRRIKRLLEAEDPRDAAFFHV
jgi:RNA polymerase sigma-70 factor, ECF subfamily